MHETTKFFYPNSFLRFLTFCSLPLIPLAYIMLIGPDIAINAYPNDLMVPLQTAWRTLQGQVPNVDFHNPVGPLYAWLEAFGMYLSNGSPMGIVVAQWIAACCLTPIFCYVIYSRCSWPTAFVAFLVPIFLIVSPRTLDHDFWSLSYIAGYNKISWGILWIIAIWSFIPSRRVSSRSIEIFMMSLCLAALVLLKIPMALVAVVFLLAARLDGWIVIGIAASIAGGILYAFGSVEGYVFDVLMASKATGDGNNVLRFDRLILDILRNIPAMGIILCAWYLASFPFKKGCIPFFLVVGGGLLCAMQSLDVTVPILMILPILFFEGSLLLSTTTSFRSGIVLAVAMMMPVSMIGLDTLSSFYFSVLPRSSEASHLIDDSSSPLYGVRFHSAPLKEPSTGENVLTFVETAWLYSEITRELMPMVTPSTRIFTVGSVNPYPYILHAREPKGGLAWWDKNRTYGGGVDEHPDIERILQDTDVLVEHRHPRDRLTQPLMQDLFRLTSRKEFRLVKETPWYRIFQRIPDASFDPTFLEGEIQ